MIGRNKVNEAAEAITLQYANGKTEGCVPGFSRFDSYIGWHIEAGKDAHLDEILKAANTTQIKIRHRRTGSPSEIVLHWNLGEKVWFYPVTNGPVAKTVVASVSNEERVQATAEAAIGLRWPRGEGQRSKMAIRGYLRDLTAAGDFRLVQISVRSHMTDVLLGALLDHGRVCERADDLVDQSRHPEVVYFHEVAMPLVAAKESQDWGKNDTATVVPFQCGHPETVDAEYIRGIWRPKDLHDQALNDYAGVVDWARDFAAKDDYSGEREQQ